METKKIFVSRGALLIDASKKIIDKVKENSDCIPSNACGTEYLMIGPTKEPRQHEEMQSQNSDFVHQTNVERII